MRPPRRAGVGGVVQGGDHPERAVPGAMALAGRGEAQSATTRPSSGAAIPQSAAQCLRALPADKLHESRCGTSTFGDDQLSGPVTGTKSLPVDPMTGVRRGARGPGAGDDRHQPRRVHPLRRAAVSAAGPALSQPSSTRSCCGRRSAPTPLRSAQRYPLERFGGSVPLAYSAAVTDGVFACVGRPDGRRPGRRPSRCTPTSSTTATRRRRSRCAQLPFPVGASHSLELRYLFDIGGAPPLNPGATGAVRPDDRLLGALRRTGLRTGLAEWPAFGTDADQAAVVVAARRQSASSPTSTTRTSARSGRA